MMLLKRLNIKVRLKIIEDKIPDITNLPTKTTLNPNINEVKREISNYFATTAAVKVKINEV